MSRESNKKARKARNKLHRDQLFDGTHVRGDMHERGPCAHFLGVFRGGTTLDLVGCGIKVPVTDEDNPSHLLVERTKLLISGTNTDVTDKSNWN